MAKKETVKLYHPTLYPDGLDFRKDYAEQMMKRGDTGGGFTREKPTNGNQSNRSKGEDKKAT